MWRVAFFSLRPRGHLVWMDSVPKVEASGVGTHDDGIPKAVSNLY